MVWQPLQAAIPVRRPDVMVIMEDHPHSTTPY